MKPCRAQACELRMHKKLLQWDIVLILWVPVWFIRYRDCARANSLAEIQRRQAPRRGGQHRKESRAHQQKWPSTAQEARYWLTWKMAYLPWERVPAPRPNRLHHQQVCVCMSYYLARFAESLLGLAPCAHLHQSRIVLAADACVHRAQAPSAHMLGRFLVSDFDFRINLLLRMSVDSPNALGTGKRWEATTSKYLAKHGSGSSGASPHGSSPGPHFGAPTSNGSNAEVAAAVATAGGYWRSVCVLVCLCSRKLFVCGSSRWILEGLPSW